MNVALLLQIVGQTAADRVVIAATWLGIIAIAAIILASSTAMPHDWRRR